MASFIVIYLLLIIAIKFEKSRLLNENKQTNICFYDG